MLRSIFTAAVFLLLVSSSIAQNNVGASSVGIGKEIFSAPAASVATPIGAPPAAGKTIQVPPGQVVTVRDDDSASFSGGSLIGQMIVGAVLIFGSLFGGFAVALIIKLLAKFGVEVSDADRARLKEFVENGLALAAQKANAELSGKLTVEVKSKVAVETLKYVQEHGADTLKKLGYDPNDPKAVEAIQARIAKLIADKSVAMGTVNVTQN